MSANCSFWRAQTAEVCTAPDWYEGFPTLDMSWYEGYWLTRYGGRILVIYSLQLICIILGFVCLQRNSSWEQPALVFVEGLLLLLRACVQHNEKFLHRQASLYQAEMLRCFRFAIVAVSGCRICSWCCQGYSLGPRQMLERSIVFFMWASQSQRLHVPI